MHQRHFSRAFALVTLLGSAAALSPVLSAQSLAVVARLE